MFFGCSAKVPVQSMSCHAGMAEDSAHTSGFEKIHQK